MRVTAMGCVDATEGAGGIPSHALLSGTSSSFPSLDQPHLESCLTGDCSVEGQMLTAFCFGSPAPYRTQASWTLEPVGLSGYY